jgi:hypothetical protein
VPCGCWTLAAVWAMAVSSGYGVGWGST